jgi:hypothetical protein
MEQRKYYFENNFSQTAHSSRFAKFYAQLKLTEMTYEVPGSIIEFGVFKGTSFLRLAKARDFFGMTNKQLIGFDSFDEFPQTESETEKTELSNFVSKAGTSKSISVDELRIILEEQSLFNNVELVKGNILETLPLWLASNQSKISLVNLDVDLAEPTSRILSLIYERMAIGGVIMLDDYSYFSEATKVIDDFCSSNGVKIQKYTWAACPHFIIKEKK